jgi:hypothetical protein
MTAEPRKLASSVVAVGSVCESAQPGRRNKSAATGSHATFRAEGDTSSIMICPK